jgi:putative tricarboxylic transport membrane protein
MQGFHFVPITIGLFGLGEVLYNASERYKVQIEEMTRAAKLGFHDIAEAPGDHPAFRLSSSSPHFLGFFTGILPGSGATPASFMSYGMAQKLSKHPEKFGKGAIEGVMAPEAANNAAGTGSILPMLVWAFRARPRPPS